MAITPAQKTAADAQQQAAAQDASPQVRVVAGPGTGKSRTIEKRVAHLLRPGGVADPRNIQVISFTRATRAELERRILTFCAAQPFAAQAALIQVSTMHSLALRILRGGNLLYQYPSDPVILDDWEQENIYDRELASSLGCTPGRATEIRLAYDASWQTLNPANMNQAQITQAERTGFTAFHGVRTNLYSCVLPGEVIHKCVEALNLGQLQASQLPRLDHLIVDEFQDLNLCDQSFVRLLCGGGAVLFVAGDDDQSIYSFRHANPDGIVQFQNIYTASATHTLTDCFRCTPNVLGPALVLIQHNPTRIPKALRSLYEASTPPVRGALQVWSFTSAVEEAKAIAASCQELIKAGMAGHEDEILILISNRRVQLDPIVRELGNLGLAYDVTRDTAITDDDGIRAVMCILRIASDALTGQPDYPAYRGLLGLLQNVGVTTVNAVVEGCVTNGQNFRDLFVLPGLPAWLATSRARGAVQRIQAVQTATSTWNLGDTLAARTAEIESLLTTHVFMGAGVQNHLTSWAALSGALPPSMTLDELLQFFLARTESEQDLVLQALTTRLGGAMQAEPTPRRIRVLTMHGAKGLDGSIVFIPSVEQGIIPSFRALHAAGLVIEQRRLFYVSVTRARAACFISHAALHEAPSSFVLAQQPTVRLPRSQFLNEMGLPSTNRNGGLTPAEAAAVVADVRNL